MANCLVDQDFQWISGDDFAFEFAVTDSSNAVVDISGSTLTWAMARNRHSTIVLTKTLGSGITITDGPNGLGQVDLDSSDGETFSGEYYHELEIILASGKKRTVLRGTIDVPVDLIP